MPAIHEVATITSKGQITLPKPIRQALGVDAGGKVAFDFTGDRVIVTRVTDEPHEDPASAAFSPCSKKTFSQAGTSRRCLMTWRARCSQRLASGSI